VQNNCSKRLDVVTAEFSSIELVLVQVGMGGSSAWGSTDAASTPEDGTKADVKTPKSAKKSKKKEKSV
jgi:hypothetical protein